MRAKNLSKIQTRGLPVVGRRRLDTIVSTLQATDEARRMRLKRQNWGRFSQTIYAALGAAFGGELAAKAAPKICLAPPWRRQEAWRRLGAPPQESRTFSASFFAPAARFAEFFAYGMCVKHWAMPDSGTDMALCVMGNAEQGFDSLVVRVRAYALCRTLLCVEVIYRVAALDVRR